LIEVRIYRLYVAIRYLAIDYLILNLVAIHAVLLLCMMLFPNALLKRHIITETTIYRGRARPVPCGFPPVPILGPLFMSPERPRSFHAGSFDFCVARWIPNAAC
jgi:hypothetical protein